MASLNWIKMLLTESASVIITEADQPPMPQQGQPDPMAGLGGQQGQLPDNTGAPPENNTTGEELTIDTVITALNNIRAGQALSEASVYQQLSDWWSKVPLTDRDVLNRLLTQIAGIAAGDQQQQEEGQPPSPPQGQTSQQPPPTPPPSSPSGGQQSGAPTPQPQGM